MSNKNPNTLTAKNHFDELICLGFSINAVKINLIRLLIQLNL
ncbi:hypothetical protein J610_3666 [Acinetobacter sp. 723929]|nr:hypothetical protein ACINWC136_1486 [Acinetobacter pittii]EXA85405.1 hypothetical protein J508_3647 [Acinetobacter sp. 1289694]EXG33258.1 hypothetical protein J733_0440 [Acinetobacter sp. 263903-2]EXI14441.1 hypothetical protein J610_3666 [Acinetobacter sp. 723929]EXR99832.1 hypothetical protein J687_2309 [Acinetobacter sp. 225588]KCY31972.1 hypothetical protein J608_5754 [Acinetobacter baumannii 1288284]